MADNKVSITTRTKTMTKADKKAKKAEATKARAAATRRINKAKKETKTERAIKAAKAAAARAAIVKASKRVQPTQSAKPHNVAIAAPSRATTKTTKGGSTQPNYQTESQAGQSAYKAKIAAQDAPEAARRVKARKDASK